MAGAVAVNKEACLNAVYKKTDCRRCRESCPQQCIDVDLEVDQNRCSECGLCLAACPAEAVWGENFSCETLDSLVADTAAPLILACRRRDEMSPWPCLGFLDARLLLALVGSGKDGPRQVAVDDRSCEGCRPQVATYLRELAEETCGLLSPDGPALIARGETAGKVERRAKTVSRRDFFSQLLGATLGTVREVMTAGMVSGEPLPRRALLEKYADRLNLANVVTTKLFYNIRIAAGCQACGFCSRVCPTKAITLQDHGATLDFFHAPQKCTGCGVCAAHCPSGALSVAEAQRLGVYHIATVELPRCTKCGQLYQPSGNKPVCLECLLKHDYRGIY
ncbi:MAG: 4Fe-4S binding protein [Negativicutes bacterium]|nr:4Fe-4S binding protein [Negativicutes bacterium]